MAKRHASRADRIGLRAAMADRLLPFMVAAMSFLAALALAGSIAAGALASHWLSGAQGLMTVEVPTPSQPVAANGPLRQDAVLTLLQATKGLSDAHLLSGTELAALLKPWLGAAAADGTLPIALPAVIVVKADAQAPDATVLGPKLASVAPGTIVDSGARWADRLAALTTSLRASAAAVLLIVALVAASVVAVAVRAGLSQRREAIEIIHGLGALDSDIANQFALRAMRLAATGGLLGGVVAVPVLAWLALLSSSFVASAPAERLDLVTALPPLLWGAPVMFTLATALIGWLAAQITVRGWLKRLA
ncbi:MAG: cell division protein FtsX [Acidiphilium sp. 37-64-53]|uniref:cell division protein FtsX n=1 Tax=Acidiphilium TaxID=522 RepID=UPI000BD193EE|nr:MULTISPECIES: FtsX-like permease family protein [Acidiphilium]OYW01384.1 MAG: cell division protein FtsX [Acidiphilium sp. 37-64-53]OZB29133.1 MAG: cell division protein FtsX [Acidiphilium sp. 34-64-41]HQT83640.1 cell division protein FtsX [Acidiphilium rubrum]